MARQEKKVSPIETNMKRYATDVRNLLINDPAVLSQDDAHAKLADKDYGAIDRYKAVKQYIDWTGDKELFKAMQSKRAQQYNPQSGTAVNPKQDLWDRTKAKIKGITKQWEKNNAAEPSEPESQPENATLPYTGLTAQQWLEKQAKDPNSAYAKYLNLKRETKDYKPGEHGITYGLTDALRDMLQYRMQYLKQMATLLPNAPDFHQYYDKDMAEAQDQWMRYSTARYHPDALRSRYKNLQLPTQAQIDSMNLATADEWEDRADYITGALPENEVQYDYNTHKLIPTGKSAEAKTARAIYDKVNRLRAERRAQVGTFADSTTLNSLRDSTGQLSESALNSYPDTLQGAKDLAENCAAALERYNQKVTYINREYAQNYRGNDDKSIQQVDDLWNKEMAEAKVLKEEAEAMVKTAKSKVSKPKFYDAFKRYYAMILQSHGMPYVKEDEKQVLYSIIDASRFENVKSEDELSNDVNDPHSRQVYKTWKGYREPWDSSVKNYKKY